MNNFGERVSFIWSVADLIRGPYRPNQYKEKDLEAAILRELEAFILELAHHLPTSWKAFEFQFEG